jgi:hypothetical protein
MAPLIEWVTGPVIWPLGVADTSAVSASCVPLASQASKSVCRTVWLMAQAWEAPGASRAVTTGQPAVWPVTVMSLILTLPVLVMMTSQVVSLAVPASSACHQAVVQFADGLQGSK